MYGRTSNAVQFMGRTGVHSTKGSRRGFADINTGVCPTADLTTRQVRDNLLRARAAASARALDENLTKSERHEARQRIYSISLKIERLRKKIKMEGLPSFFMEQAKRNLPTEVYQDLVSMARDEWMLASDWPDDLGGTGK